MRMRGGDAGGRRKPELGAGMRMREKSSRGSSNRPLFWNPELGAGMRMRGGDAGGRRKPELGAGMRMREKSSRGSSNRPLFWNPELGAGMRMRAGDAGPPRRKPELGADMRVRPRRDAESSRGSSSRRGFFDRQNMLVVFQKSVVALAMMCRRRTTLPAGVPAVEKILVSSSDDFSSHCGCEDESSKTFSKCE